MRKKLIDGIKYWGQVLLLPIYWISFLTPRDKNIWLFGSTFGNRFADNPKYLYLYANQNQKNEIRPIWITHNKDVVQFLNGKNYEVYYYRSLKGIYYCLRGKVYIFDNYSKDISFWLSGGATKVNLWHGVGNKKINYDNKFDKVRHPKNNWEKFKTFLRRMSDEKPSHYVLATSPVKTKIFMSAFRVAQSHIIEAGLPRNDALLDPEFQNLYNEKEKELITSITNWRKKNLQVNCYMPTFRNSETKLFSVMNFDKFNHFLVQNNMIFLVKLHPKSIIANKFKEFNYSNIKYVDANIDPYTFLQLVDILTTDYSSIYTDFMLLNRPVVGFYYDYDSYSQDTRECYFDFDEYMPELKAYNMDELIEVIKRVMLEDICLKNRIKSRDRMFATPNELACEKVYNKIYRIIG